MPSRECLVFPTPDSASASCILSAYAYLNVCIYTDPASACFAVILLGCSCFLLQSICLNDMELIMNVVSVPSNWAGSSFHLSSF